MAVKSFSCYLTYYQIAQLLESDKQRGIYWNAVMAYMFDDVDMEDSLPKAVKMAFINAKSHLKTSQRQSQNGTKRKPNESQTETTSKPNQSQTKAKTEQYKDKDKDKYKDKQSQLETAPTYPTSMPEHCRAELVELGLIREVR